MQLVALLDPFGDDPRIHPAGETAEHLDERGLGLVVVEAGDQFTVEFHEVRPDGQNPVQTCIPGADVVDTDETTAVAYLGHRSADDIVIGDRGVFGEFDDHPRQVGVLQQFLDGVETSASGATLIVRKQLAGKCTRAASAFSTTIASSSMARSTRTAAANHRSGLACRVPENG